MQLYACLESSDRSDNRRIAAAVGFDDNWPSTYEASKQAGPTLNTQASIMYAPQNSTILRGFRGH